MTLEEQIKKILFPWVGYDANTPLVTELAALVREREKAAYEKGGDDGIPC